MAYRDELAAAHERIADLERERAASIAPTREAAKLAALERERRSVLAELESPMGGLGSVLGWKFYIPFVGVAVAFLLDGDPLFASLAVGAAFFLHWVARKVVTSNRRNAERHLALLEAEIARLC